MSLSDKRIKGFEVDSAEAHDGSTNWFLEEDVKESFKKIINGFMVRFYGSDVMPTVAYDEFLEFIKEEAGPKLVEKK